MNCSPVRGDILIVDDTVDSHAFYQRCCFSKRYESSGKHAWFLALMGVQAQPPVGLLDINMPGMNGYEVCQRLKPIQHLEIPCDFLSAE